MGFLKIMLCYYFSLEVILQGVAKNNPTVKQIDEKIQATMEHVPAVKTSRRENVKIIVTNCKERFKLQITTTCI